ncbi:hypothetical protein Tco_1407185 [Tanacetum coccineum]
MAESSSQKTSSLEITPKEEPVTLDKPKSPNPFLPASQVDFTFDEITFTTNNEVALLYPSHPNQDYFEAVSDFISKCCLKEAFTRAPNQYKEYPSEVWYTIKTLDDSKVWISSPTGGIRGDIGITTFKNALMAQYPPHSKHMIHEYENEELTINLTQVFSVHNLTLKPNQPEEPPFTDHMKAICNLDVPVDSKALKPSSQTEEETKSSSAKDKIPSHPSPPTPVKKKPTLSSVVGMDEGTKNYSFDHIFAGSNLSVLVDKTKSVRDGLKTAHTDSGANEESRADDISLKVKLKDLSDILKDTRSAFFTPNSPTR